MGENLKIAIKELKKNEQTFVKNAIYLPISPYYLFEDNIFFVSFDGKIIPEKEGFIFETAAKAEFATECSNCLKRLEYKIDFFIKEYFGDTTKDFENLPIIDGEIDLAEAIVVNLLLNRPSRSICDEFCKGLCPICGKDLNLDSCSCKYETINEEFNKLKDFFE